MFARVVSIAWGKRRIRKCFPTEKRKIRTNIAINPRRVGREIVPMEQFNLECMSRDVLREYDLLMFIESLFRFVGFSYMPIKGISISFLKFPQNFDKTYQNCQNKDIDADVSCKL